MLDTLIQAFNLITTWEVIVAMLAASVYGLVIGSLDQKRSLELPSSIELGVATVSLPLRPSRETTPARLRALSSGTHRFTVEGRATFDTPLGTRLVHFAQSGDMSFGPPVADSASASTDSAAAPPASP